jgi:hypothetical protein
MGQFLQVNGDYNIKVRDGGTIKLDTGPSGDTFITGNLTVQGDVTSISTTNLEIEDRIITLNDGENGPGVSLVYSGIEIDRGTYVDSTAVPRAAFVWNETNPGFTGILINGVEIRNYKSSDVVYYGKLDEIEVTSPGSDYDVINPPLVNISDSIGVGATGYAAVSGSLQRIRVLDSGFDYIETPTIKISGGNGSGAVASPNMKLIDHSVLFNSEDSSTYLFLLYNPSSVLYHNIPHYNQTYFFR